MHYTCKEKSYTRNVTFISQEYARVDLQKVIGSVKVDLQKLVASAKAGLQKVAPAASFPCQTNAAATTSAEATADGSCRQQPVARAESMGPTQWAKPQTRVLHISSLCLYGEEDELSLAVGFTVKILDWITPTVAVFLIKKASSQPTVSANNNVKTSTSAKTEGEVVVSSGGSVGHVDSMATMTLASSTTTHPLSTETFDVSSHPFVIEMGLGAPEMSSSSSTFDMENLVAESHSAPLVMALQHSVTDPSSVAVLGSVPVLPSVGLIPMPAASLGPTTPIPLPLLGPLPIPPPPEITFGDKEDSSLPGAAELLLLIPLLEHRVSDTMSTIPLVKQVVPVQQDTRIVTIVEFQDEGVERGVLLAIGTKGKGRGAVSMLVSDLQELRVTSSVKCVCPVTVDNAQPSSLLAVCQRGMVTLLSTEKWNVVGCYVDQLLSPSHCVFCPDRRELIVVSAEGQAQVLQITVAKEDLKEDIPDLLGM